MPSVTIYFNLGALLTAYVSSGPQAKIPRVFLLGDHLSSANCTYQVQLALDKWSAEMHRVFF